jgi:hypothetical protein
MKIEAIEFFSTECTSIEDPKDARKYLQVRRRTSAAEAEKGDLQIKVRSKRTSYWIDVLYAGHNCS